MDIDIIPSTEVRRIRRTLGLTQAQLAEKLGVTKVSVGRWETGKRRCKGDYARCLRQLASPREVRNRRAATLAHLGLRTPMTETLDLYARQFREATLLLDQLQPQLLAMEQIMPVWHRQFEEMQFLQTRLALPASYLRTFEDVQQLIASNPILESFSSLAEGTSLQFEGILRKWHHTDQLIAGLGASLPDLSSFSTRFVESMVPAESLLRVAEASRSAVEVMLGPQVAFQHFVDHQLQLAAGSAEIAKRNRLLLLDSSTGLLQALTAGLEFSALTGPRPLDLGDVTARLPNVFSQLEFEIEEVDLSADDLNPESVVADGPVARSIDLGSELVRHVYLINVDAQRTGNPVVFKPTNRSFLAGAALVANVAIDEASFNEIVEHLYLLLYEGSGKAARLLGKDGQLPAPLWLLKQLRLGARHDLDHGSRSDIARKHKKVGDAFRPLIGVALPRSRKDWVQAQMALYEKLVRMLIDLWSKAAEEKLSP